MFVKKITKVLRGNATPAQMMMACVLGAVLGFMPGFTQAPGLIVAIILLLIVLNANLALATLVAAGAKLASLLLMPLSFSAGRFLLDGPTQPLFKTMINMPVLALFGFEYYVTTGGLLLGGALGIVVGALLIKLVRGIRTTLSGLEEGSDRYKQWMAKWWVKLLLSLMLGRGAKETYTAMLEKRGKVIRLIGVVFCVAAVGLLFAAQTLYAGSFITSALQKGLEQANGATVDLERVDVDLAEGKMTITGLAMTDANALDRDLFQAATIEVDVSSTSLLRKRLKLDRVVISDAVHGAPRATPGQRIGSVAVAVTAVAARQGEKTLADYLKDPARYQKRLVQIRRWLETLSGPGNQDQSAEKTEDKESFRERLEREAELLGYAHVTASHLIEGAPQFAVAELIADKVRTDALQGETLDIRITNISTQPYLVNETPTVAMKSSGKTLRLGLELSAVSAAGGENQIDLQYLGLPVDSIADDLSVKGVRPISGGTMDIAMQGTVRTTGGTYIDLPLQVTLHKTTVAVAGKTAPVEQLMLALALRGPIDNPRIRIDDSKLADALVAAGASAVASEVRGEADKLIKKQLGKVDLKKNLGGIDIGKVLPALGRKNDAKTADQDSDEKNKKNNKIGGKLKDLTKGLFGKKKKSAGDKNGG